MRNLATELTLTTSSSASRPAGTGTRSHERTCEKPGLGMRSVPGEPARGDWSRLTGAVLARSAEASYSESVLLSSSDDASVAGCSRSPSWASEMDAIGGTESRLRLTEDIGLLNKLERGRRKNTSGSVRKEAQVPTTNVEDDGRLPGFCHRLYKHAVAVRPLTAIDPKAAVIGIVNRNYACTTLNGMRRMLRINY